MGEVELDLTLRFRPSKDAVDFARFALDQGGQGGPPPPPCIKAIVDGSGNADPSRTLLTADGLRWMFRQRQLLPEFCKVMRDGGTGKALRFHQLAGGCQMILPEPQFPPRDPELEARVQRLKAQQADREYRQMTLNVDGRIGLRLHHDDDPISLQMKEINNYLLIVLQFVISIVVGFLFGFFAPYFFAGIADTGTRLIYGILTAFVLAVADLYFIMKFLLETEGLIENGNLSFFDASKALNKKKAL